MRIHLKRARAGCFQTETGDGARGERNPIMLVLMMNRILDTTEVLGIVEKSDGKFELCVSAEANYDESAGRVAVQLESFLRTTELQAKEKRLPGDWLPMPERVEESIGPDEAVAVARDIFQSWVRKVRESTPSLREPAHP
jgi:hypothetical protein